MSKTATNYIGLFLGIIAGAVMSAIIYHYAPFLHVVNESIVRATGIAIGGYMGGRYLPW